MAQIAIAWILAKDGQSLKLSIISCVYITEIFAYVLMDKWIRHRHRCHCAYRWHNEPGESERHYW